MEVSFGPKNSLQNKHDLKLKIENYSPSLNKCYNFPMQKKIADVLYLWFPLVFWCLVIFIFSNIPKTIDIGPTYWTNFFAKKTAHFIEFAILGILAKRSFKNTWMALIFTLLYAASDEYHQAFIPGRESRIRDVIIDFTGGGFGIWILKYIPFQMKKKLKI